MPGSSVVTSTSNMLYALETARQNATISVRSLVVNAAVASPSVLYGGVVMTVP